MASTRELQKATQTAASKEEQRYPQKMKWVQK
jgi:hypothetical protein